MSVSLFSEILILDYSKETQLLSDLQVILIVNVGQPIVL